MKLKEKIKTELGRHKLTRRLLNYDSRTILFTVGSLAISAAYAAFYGMLGIALRSVWYGMLAAYYLMLVVMRGIVVFYHRRKHKKGDDLDGYKEKLSRARIYRSCGIVICLLTLPLSISILLMVAEKMTFSHAGLMIYVSATYTFYKVVMAIRSKIKARASTDMTVQTVRSINLADMLVSVLALQTAMFHSFSPDFDTGVFNAVTGAAVCLGTVIVGAFLIANGTRAITRIKYERHLQQSQIDENNIKEN